jgi:hypothetical protein
MSIRVVAQVLLAVIVVTVGSAISSALFGRPFDLWETLAWALVSMAALATIQVAFARLDSVERRLRFLERQTGLDQQAKHERGEADPPGF